MSVIVAARMEAKWDCLSGGFEVLRGLSPGRQGANL